MRTFIQKNADSRQSAAEVEMPEVDKIKPEVHKTKPEVDKIKRASCVFKAKLRDSAVLDERQKFSVTSSKVTYSLYFFTMCFKGMAT